MVLFISSDVNVINLLIKKINGHGIHFSINIVYLYLLFITFLLMHPLGVVYLVNQERFVSF